jgi:putative toxin-antitoxin system antitoxin component (TIGR02293 family)
MEPSTTLTLVQQIKEGFPASSLEHFQQSFGLSFVQAAQLLGIPRRTLIRRKEQGHLGSDESERLLRFARLLGAALELFEGDEEAVHHWLQTPKIGKVKGCL